MNLQALSGEAGFAAALLDPDRPCPTGLRGPAGEAQRRFAVHRNNVVASLVDAVAESFPVVLALVGEAFFRAIASVFVREQPPRSPLLHAYGGAFPVFVEGFGPAASLPYLTDVARLEWARVQACHAADAQPLQPGQAALPADPERAGELLLVPHPALRVLSCAHAAVSIWAARQGQGALEQVDLTRAEHALVLRPSLEVLVGPCDAGTVAFVRCLQDGAALAQAAAAGAAAGDFDLAGCLALLLRHGALRSISLPEPPP